MIVMVPDVRAALLKEKEFQEELELKSVPIKGCVDGKSVIVKDFVFLKTTGFPYCKDEVNHSLRRIKDTYNKQETEKAITEKREPVLIKQLSSHIMRHTFSTRCVESDMNIKVVQSIMGHEDIKTTMNIYTDVKDDKIHKEFEKADIFKLP